MLKRILAWVLLAGFVLLLVNIMIFQYFIMPSIAVYVLVAVWFILTNKPLPSRKDKKASENSIEEKTKE